MRRAKTSKPTLLPISPVSLACPACRAKPGHDCTKTSGGLSAICIERLTAAALINVARRNEGRRLRKL